MKLILQNLKQRTQLCSLLLLLFISALHLQVRAQSLSFRFNTNNHGSDQLTLIDSLDVLPSKKENSNRYEYDLSYAHEVNAKTDIFLRVGASDMRADYISKSFDDSLRKRTFSTAEHYQDVLIDLGVLTELIRQNKFVLSGGLAVNYTKNIKNEYSVIARLYDFEENPVGEQTIDLGLISPYSYGMMGVLRNEYLLTEKLSVFLELNYLYKYRTKIGVQSEIIQLSDENGVLESRINSREIKETLLYKEAKYVFGVSWRFK